MLQLISHLSMMMRMVMGKGSAILVVAVKAVAGTRRV